MACRCGRSTTSSTSSVTNAIAGHQYGGSTSQRSAPPKYDPSASLPGRINCCKKSSVSSSMPTSSQPLAQTHTGSGQGEGVTPHSMISLIRGQERLGLSRAILPRVSIAWIMQSWTACWRSISTTTASSACCAPSSRQGILALQELPWKLLDIVVLRQGLNLR
jgi:hypothetical protein